MGTVTMALARSATSHGAEIRAMAPVGHIFVKGGRAQGVVIEDGTEFYGKAILSSVDPRRTFLNLVSANDLDPKFREAVQSISMNGSGSMLHFLLDGLPHFRSSAQWHDRHCPFNRISS
jgi:phytoene dehydrogenase-like protein